MEKGETMNYVMAPVTAVGIVLLLSFQYAPQDSGPRIGLVNLRMCFDEEKYDYAHAVTKELKELEAQLGKDVEDEKTTREAARTAFIERYKEVKARVYEEVLRGLDGFMRDKKLDLILKVDDPKLHAEATEANGTISQQIQARSVLSYGRSLDLTEEAIAYLNKEYAKKKGE
jgi:Skp family chaperone for outer membrane proteins